MGFETPELNFPTRIPTAPHYTSHLIKITTMFAILHPKYQTKMGLPAVPKIASCALMGILCLSRPCLAAPDSKNFWESYRLYIITIVAISVPLLCCSISLTYCSGSKPEEAGNVHGEE